MIKKCPVCDYTSPTASYCPYHGSVLQEPEGPARKTIYLHNSKEENGYMADELGLTGDAESKFWYTLMELGVVVDIDLTTGQATMIGVEDNGEVVELERPVNV